MLVNNKNFLNDVQELIAKFETKKNYSRNQSYKRLLDSFNDIKEYFDKVHFLQEKIKPFNYYIQLNYHNFDLATIDKNVVYSHEIQIDNQDLDEMKDVLFSFLESFCEAVDTARKTDEITDMPEELENKINSVDTDKYNELYEKVPPIIYENIPLHEFEFLNDISYFTNCYVTARDALIKIERKELKDLKSLND